MDLSERCAVTYTSGVISEEAWRPYRRYLATIGAPADVYKRAAFRVALGINGPFTPIEEVFDFAEEDDDGPDPR